MPRVVFIAAGVDASGGAGLVADIAVVAARGLHPVALPTALTLQDSRSCRAVQPVDPGWLEEQLGLLLEDFAGRVGAIKIGMLGQAEIALALARGLAPLVRAGVPLVLDPVLRASVGAALVAGDPAAVLAPLLPLVTLLTPNRDEAERLTGIAVADEAGQHAAAATLRERGARAVLVKGGHLPGDEVCDLLDDGQGPLRLRSRRIAGPVPHGTGCALASEIAAQLALGLPLRAAVTEAHGHIARRIAGAVQLGRGRPFLAPPGLASPGLASPTE
ncbi:MAG TPA: bifunctional hydroxymethylpyrimidine kinase/phosphomethylpyrimidine kinase [Polyangia bacterium]|jgi:hydroxymethylpyrimidine/phosphomethylpyrimidine kinase|nr:bifunctional hydroxymethylpyrimidine kinase/phosphomethylpyrimidine kinase [Polyangia bacterium]